MAYRVIWTACAADDLQAIAEYIGRDSQHYAAAVVDKIENNQGQTTAITRISDNFAPTPLSPTDPQFEKGKMRSVQTTFIKAMQASRLTVMKITASSFFISMTSQVFKLR